MQVEIWSDIMCPFCYIGKRNFEAGMNQFSNAAQIEVIWKSFQLDPTIPQDEEITDNVFQYLADRKGISYEQALSMHKDVVQTAKNAGLEYNFDKAVVANSFKAHRMIQLAKTKNMGDEAEERLFKAYFTEGKNFGKTEVLIQLGIEIGLTEDDVLESQSNDLFAQQVMNDIQEAQQLGVNGVPFFVFDRKYAISGAQPSHSFMQVLEKSYDEFAEAQISNKLQIENGPNCDINGNCD